MPRTSTTVINDFIRETGPPCRIDVHWDIPVKRPRWGCAVSISLYKHKSDKALHIWVHAYGYRKGKDAPQGRAHYIALQGNAVPGRLNRKWVESVLRREIETARAAALSFVEADLHEELQFPSDEFYRGMEGYFHSSLKNSEG
jgi:hypothetical protein